MRILIILNILFAALFVSPFIGRPKVIHIEERFSIKNMPTSTILAELNIVPTIVKDRDMLEVNTVNHQSKSITIRGVVFDLDAIHYMLYQLPDLEDRIDEWLALERSGEEVLAMSRFKSYLVDNSLQYKARFYRFNQETHFVKIVEDFLYDLFLLGEKSVNLDFITNQEVRPYEVRFYEDFDEEKMVAGAYGLYHVYSRNTYYLESDLCTDFNLYSKISEQEKQAMIDGLDEVDYVEEDGCYTYVFEQLDYDLSFELLEEKLYQHNTIFVFDYQSHSTKPYARFRVAFDHFYEEKLLISSETSNFKISKEASDYRNQYNVELVESYGETRAVPVDIIYPHRNLVEDKELWFYTKSNYFHQMLEGNQYNVKYRKDMIYYDEYDRENMFGGLELIYDSVGYVVYDPLTIFTFNYGISDLNHYLKDVYPFLLWGTSVENRESYRMVERFIWDKDRFTIFKYGHVLEKEALRQYYDTRLKNVIIGSEVPIDILDDIDDYYEKTR
ncbi:MAG: hypothetical protein ACVCEJ_07710 [Candidatus Izemoplasmataceae bacterium]